MDLEEKKFRSNSNFEVNKGCGKVEGGWEAVKKEKKRKK